MDLIENPYKILDEMFKANMRQNPNSSGEKLLSDFGDEKYFNAKLNCEQFMTSVPDFDKFSVGKISSNTMVRFHGLVQDVYDPEFYCGAFENNETGELVVTKYRDIIRNEWDSEEAHAVFHLERCFLHLCHHHYLSLVVTSLLGIQDSIIVCSDAWSK